MVVYQLPFSNPTLSDGWGSTLPPRVRAHNGLDFPQPVGAAITSIADGVVVTNSSSPGLGNYVVVGHADGMYSGYCHSRIPFFAYPGDVVSRGGLLGVVGDKGFAFGPHLHLTLGTWAGSVGSNSIDPYPYIMARSDGDGTGDDGGGVFPPVPGPQLGTKTWNNIEALRPSTTIRSASGKVRITATARGGGAMVTYSIPGIREKEVALQDRETLVSQLLFPASSIDSPTISRTWIQDGLPTDKDVTITFESYGQDWDAHITYPSILAEIVY